MTEIDTQIGCLAKSIRETDIYRTYRDQIEKIDKVPGLMERINDFRQKNLALQSTTPSEDMLDKVEAFRKEYEHFREEPLVEDFLQAELEVCRMMQDIQVKLTEAIDFV